jgi:hypothetical protein
MRNRRAKAGKPGPRSSVFATAGRPVSDASEPAPNEAKKKPRPESRQTDFLSGRREISGGDRPTGRPKEMSPPFQKPAICDTTGARRTPLRPLPPVCRGGGLKLRPRGSCGVCRLSATKEAGDPRNGFLASSATRGARTFEGSTRDGRDPFEGARSVRNPLSGAASNRGLICPISPMLDNRHAGFATANFPGKTTTCSGATDSVRLWPSLTFCDWLWIAET